MEVILILAIVFIAVAVVIYGVLSHIKKSEKQKYYAAAGNIVREDFLNYSLKNQMQYSEDIPVPGGQKTMVYIKNKSGKNKIQFVFDPEKGISMGRDKYRSNIYINDIAVSQEHCRIYSENGKIYLQDLNSVNGTLLKRGLFTKYNIYGNSIIELQDGDRLIVGCNEFKVTLFYFDMSIM